MLAIRPRSACATSPDDTRRSARRRLAGPARSGGPPGAGRATIGLVAAKTFYKARGMGAVAAVRDLHGAGARGPGGGEAGLRGPGVAVRRAPVGRSSPRRRAGRDLVVSLTAVWDAAGCLTAARQRALRAHLARVARRAGSRARVPAPTPGRRCGARPSRGSPAATPVQRRHRAICARRHARGCGHRARAGGPCSGGTRSAGGWTGESRLAARGARDPSGGSAGGSGAAPTVEMQRCNEASLRLTEGTMTRTAEDQDPPGATALARRASRSSRCS